MRWALLALVALAGCTDPRPPLPPVGARRLVILDPPGFQLGLHYDTSIDLPVRVITDDGAEVAIAGAEVRFSIFGDPAGSTLSSDRARADADGLAAVRLSAGRAEASFQVVATADFADDAHFVVSVSKLDFISLDTVLDYDGAHAGDIKKLSARLYEDRACAQLSAAGAPPDAPRTLTSTSAPPITLSFPNLLQRSYAVMARGETQSGHLVAYGCVDVLQAQLPPGTRLTAPVPMTEALPSVAGTYALTTTLAPSSAVALTATSAWRELSTCPFAGGERLLDHLSAATTMPLQTAIAQKRGPLDGNGCRPALVMGVDSLDKRLDQILKTTAATPASLAAAIRADLVAIVAAGTLTSTLTLVDAGSAGLLGTHRLGEFTVGVSTSSTKTFDLFANGLPEVIANDVLVAPAGPSLLITSHAFTFGFRALWRDALFALAILPRLPSLPTPSVEAFTNALVDAASYMGETGCAAVEQLVCDVTGAGACVLLAACQTATTTIADALDAGFTDASGFDFNVEGSAVSSDADGDLVVDHLSGAFVTSLDPSAAAAFTGTRTP